jgi:cytochrome c peroxidase
MFVRAISIIAVGLLAGAAIQGALAFPVGGDQTVLPAGTELNEDAIDQPREVFKSEAIDGRKSYLVNLGDLAFNAPTILGGVARQAGISCSTCHVNGASNPRLFVPGMSAHPGTFDTTGPLLNPKADNLTFDPVRIPSLRGARYLAPYGHDGRMASLRDFIRNVIVVEFSGPEPSPSVLDALVIYIQDIDFLPNPNIGAGGKLTGNATDAERRGELLFNKPFPHDPNLSCAACHVPSGAFVDHLQHDVGSGGLHKTPTLLNADFNAPYFHDGRYTTFGQVVAHFDRTFDLGLSAQDQHDLVAYLGAIGDGAQPYEHDGSTAKIRETNDFASVLGPAIAAHDKDIIALAVDTVGGELRELAEHIPDWKDTSVAGGAKERSLARTALKQVVLMLRRINIDAAAGRFDDAAAEYKSYTYLMTASIPALVSRAEPWSLFTPSVHDAHYAALQQVLQSKKSGSQ